MISAVILSKNSALTIDRCLISLTFCREIIVIDDYSTDKTLQICRKYTSYVYQRKLADNFSSQRNFALTKCNNDWVLYIDSDETVSKDLKDEILTAIKNENMNGYYIPRKEFFLGKEMKWGEFLRFKLMRLGRKKSGIWKRPIHEVWEITGNCNNLSTSLIHHSHEKLESFLNKINYYSNINAKFIYENYGRPNVLAIIAYPLLKIFYIYILKLGFLDGTHGAVSAFLMGWHSFLSRAKAYFLNA